MKTGIWLNYPGVPLEDKQVVLIRRRNTSWYEMATYNADEECFDDSFGDDYLCDLDDVVQILVIPDFDE
jgi:hypothetical protein